MILSSDAMNVHRAHISMTFLYIFFKKNEKKETIKNKFLYFLFFI